jgi:manganese/zinc/iron transport system permease protein
MSAQGEILLIAIIVSTACAIPGLFLVLRSMAMMSDAITHTILLGIVVAFFIVHSLTSPFLILGAALMGLLTVFMVESITKTKLMAEDSAIGIVFPFLFSIAIILITRYAGSVHFDTDAVLLGELAFAPFSRFMFLGRDLGAKAIYVMGTVLLINLLLVFVFFKELKIATFDPALAAVLGLAPGLIHYGLMASVSLQPWLPLKRSVPYWWWPSWWAPCDGLFIDRRPEKDDADQFCHWGAQCISGLSDSHVAGCFIAGSMATLTGLTFLLVFFVAPNRGMLSVLLRRRRQKVDFAEKSLLFHLHNHEGDPDEALENGRNTIYDHLHWPHDFLDRLVKRLIHSNYVVRRKQYQTENLTDQGRAYCHPKL